MRIVWARWLGCHNSLQILISGYCEKYHIQRIEIANVNKDLAAKYLAKYHHPLLDTAVPARNLNHYIMLR
jgi:hypothetical protein